MRATAISNSSLSASINIPARYSESQGGEEGEEEDGGGDKANGREEEIGIDDVCIEEGTWMAEFNTAATGTKVETDDTSSDSPRRRFAELIRE
jgi:hypothetical protein